MDEELMMNASASTSINDEVEAGPSTSTSTSERPEGMSKNAQKKAAKQAKMLAMKPLKRAAEKARRKERAAELTKGYAEGTLSERDKEIYEKRKRLERERKAEKRRFGNGLLDDGSVQVWGGGVVLDLGFDELMNEQEINSMSSQIGFCYSTNRIAPGPFRSIIHTSFSPAASPRLWAKMVDRGWDRWSRSCWWGQDVGVLNEVLKSHPSEGTEEQKRNDQVISEQISQNQDQDTDDSLQTHLTGPTLPPGMEKGNHTLIYLSADAEEELETLDENHIYVIGGIVDRNRYKGLCQSKAEKLGIKTARLPIGKFIENLPTRKVLTVNQVFDILLQYIAQNDWQKAFESVIPQRKFHESKKAKHQHNAGGDEDDKVVAQSNGEDNDEVQGGIAEEVILDNEESTMNQ
ncbi:hypothetical protein I302_102324 [Kwoniella bestiolae CBS 10118]|uniref:tRNA (guanine(9)-N1)-methyltransferase n=1 Tax=Kwoniella bestiolae CBS 10118 TaxID=1296100 RepID=A0A1B9GET8_9TREE|nr:hypothetical protein I302_01016 [Kwoniella bestiolae CBS 10118]OCF29509.1 hypothetical protein I302_01016 [Kwoniella bestiolae CBS 10118]